MSITSIKIIDNKKLAMTSEEYKYYQDICKSYNQGAFHGEDLFKGLFESNDKGIITFLRPPTSSYSSMECYLYIVSIYNHQHMRIIYEQCQSLMNEVRAELAKVRENKT
jgi:hypothetical protein